MEELSEISAINSALKAICRELGIERDRKSLFQIATLLIRLVKEGCSLDTDHLVAVARNQLADAGSMSTPERSAATDMFG